MEKKVSIYKNVGNSFQIELLFQNNDYVWSIK